MGMVSFVGLGAGLVTIAVVPVVGGWPCRLKQGSKHALCVCFSIDVCFIVLAH